MWSIRLCRRSGNVLLARGRALARRRTVALRAGAVVAFFRVIDGAVAAMWAEQTSGVATTVSARVESGAQVALLRRILSDSVAAVGG